MGNLPKTMMAIDPQTAGGPEVLALVACPLPKPTTDEVLIKVHAAGVNRADIMQREGHYPPPPGAPTILGLEVAGIVVAAGDSVDPALVGHSVCALLAGGGYAEYAVVSQGQVLPIPGNLSMVEAAAFPEALYTVWTNLFERAFAAEGDTVLVHGGTSGIGTMAIALGKLFGLTVIVTCGTDAKCAAARKLGAAHAINYQTEDFVAAVHAITAHKGVQAVLDLVGGAYVPRNLKCLAADGRHVTIAVPSGAKAEINLLEMMQKRLTLSGATLRGRDAAFKTLVTEELKHNVWPHVAAGRLKPIVDQVFPLSQAAEAHRRMAAGDHVGKIILAVG